jgi:ribosomal protein S18 acetylase RimI-like enzyme
LADGFTFAPLGAAHDRSGFSCGVSALDRYFRELAMQDIRRRVSNCFVVLDQDGGIAGYCTLAATSLPLPEISAEHARRLPRYTALPAVLIGRLAVDRAFQGRGIGGAMIVDAISRAVRAEPAIFALIVDAKDAAALAFYEHLGFQQFVSRPVSQYLPIAEAVRRLGSNATAQNSRCPRR